MNRLKIAHVSPYDLAIRGGVNASVFQLVRRQRALGHTVDLIGGASADREDLRSWRRVPAAIASVPANGSVAALALPTDAGPGGELEHLVSGYDVLVLHEPALPLGQAVLDVSRSANVGVMHAYSETLLRAAHLARVFTPRQGIGALSPWLRRLDRRIAVSSAARDFAASYLRGDYTLIPNGIDVPWRGARTLDPSTIVFLGRPEPRKGLDVLLEALPIVRRAHVAARLIVAGDGTDAQWAPYRDRARELGVDAAVTFSGRVSEAQKRELFARASVYVSPATGGESQGVVLLEAMALGAPVVASDIAGYRTVVTNGTDGLLVRASDPAALANGIARVLSDPSLAARLADRARDTVAHTYDWRVVIPRHLDLYAAAMRDRRDRERAALRSTGGRSWATHTTSKWEVQR